MTLPSNLLELLQSPYATIDTARHIIYLEVPKNNHSLPLSPEQAIAAKIEPAGNAGRSKIRVSFEFTVEICGTPQEVQLAINRALYQRIVDLESSLSPMPDSAIGPAELAEIYRND